MFGLSAFAQTPFTSLVGPVYASRWVNINNNQTSTWQNIDTQIKATNTNAFAELPFGGDSGTSTSTITLWHPINDNQNPNWVDIPIN